MSESKISTDCLRAIVRDTKDILLHPSAGRTVKGYADFVTDTDIAVQEAIVSALGKVFPDVPVLSEEMDSPHIPKGRFFVLDPLDGTTNHSMGFPMFAVSLAYVENGEVVAGVVYDPVRNEMFEASIGQGATLNGNPVTCSSRRTLDESLIGIGTNPYNRNKTRRRFEQFGIIFDHVLDIRRTGSAALDLCYVGCGRLDAFYESGLKLWDYAAGMLIARESGASVTGTDGHDLGITLDASIIAGNVHLVKAILGLVGD